MTPGNQPPFTWHTHSGASATTKSSLENSLFLRWIACLRFRGGFFVANVHIYTTYSCLQSTNSWLTQCALYNLVATPSYRCSIGQISDSYTTVSSSVGFTYGDDFHLVFASLLWRKWLSLGKYAVSLFSSHFFPRNRCILQFDFLEFLFDCWLSHFRHRLNLPPVFWFRFRKLLAYLFPLKCLLIPWWMLIFSMGFILLFVHVGENAVRFYLLWHCWSRGFGLFWGPVSSSWANIDVRDQNYPTSLKKKKMSMVNLNSLTMFTPRCMKSSYSGSGFRYLCLLFMNTPVLTELTCAVWSSYINTYLHIYRNTPIRQECHFAGLPTRSFFFFFKEKGELQFQQPGL